MKLGRRVLDELAVPAGGPARLRTRSTTSIDATWLGAAGRADPKAAASERLADFTAQLGAAQGRLYAADRWSLLLVLQGPDAAGKDGTIKHVMSGVNPQGCSVASFKEPSSEELSHDFLWRCSKALPARGRIGIFNRSYYEEVLVVRVHPELLEAERLPDRHAVGRRLWKERFDDVNAFEHHLVRNGTRVLKLYLHVSQEEQRRRLLKRTDDPTKQWKLSATDLAEHQRFGDYRVAYEEALSATSTAWAPWYVVPADRKYLLRALVAGIVVHAIDELDLELPTLGPDQRREIEAARRALEEQAPSGRPHKGP